MSKKELLKQIAEETRDVWDKPDVRLAVRENIRKMLACQTPALGWSVYASENEEKRCNHTCKSRFCPSCGYRALLSWLDEQQAVLPDVPYSGLIFTMPKALWAVFAYNRHLLHDLPTLAAAVIKQWMRLEYDAVPIVLIVPHTFGGYLNFYPHFHTLVSAGGLRGTEARWISDVTFDNSRLMRMWRGAVITHLQNALRAGVLSTHLTTDAFTRMLRIEYERDWVVLLGDHLNSKADFLAYIARYFRRPALGTSRLIALDKGTVSFLAKDTRKHRLVPMTLPARKFIKLLARHIPNRYQHAIRFYGLLSPRTKNKARAAMFLVLGQRVPARPQRLSWRASLIKHFGVDPLIDNNGEPMHLVHKHVTATN